ncbi:MAG: NTPase [Candidatus Njordarchaeia archaeon]
MKVKNFLITGPPRSGKTTLLMDIAKKLEEMGYKISGITCPEIREQGRRKGFKIIDIEEKREGTLASVTSNKPGPKIGKYTVNIEDLDEIGTKAITKAINGDAEIILIDEIGVMELMSKNFQQAVKNALNSQKPVIGIIHRKSNHPLLREIRTRKDIKIYHIDRTTPKTQREKIKKEIIEQVKNLCK